MKTKKNELVASPRVFLLHLLFTRIVNNNFYDERISLFLCFNSISRQNWKRWGISSGFQAYLHRKPFITWIATFTGTGCNVIRKLPHVFGSSSITQTAVGWQKSSSSHLQLLLSVFRGPNTTKRTFSRSPAYFIFTAFSKILTAWFYDLSNDNRVNAAQPLRNFTTRANVSRTGEIYAEILSPNAMLPYTPVFCLPFLVLPRVAGFEGWIIGNVNYDDV